MDELQELYQVIQSLGYKNTYKEMVDKLVSDQSFLDKAIITINEGKQQGSFSGYSNSAADIKKIALREINKRGTNAPQENIVEKISSGVKEVLIPEQSQKERNYLSEIGVNIPVPEMRGDIGTSAGVISREEFESKAKYTTQGDLRDYLFQQEAEQKEAERIKEETEIKEKQRLGQERVKKYKEADEAFLDKMVTDKYLELPFIRDEYIKDEGLLDAIEEIKIGENDIAFTNELNTKFSKYGISFDDIGDGIIKAIGKDNVKVIDLNKSNSEEQIKSFIEDNIDIEKRWGSPLENEVALEFKKKTGKDYFQEKTIYDNYIKKQEELAHIKKNKDVYSGESVFSTGQYYIDKYKNVYTPAGRMRSDIEEYKAGLEEDIKDLYAYMRDNKTIDALMNIDLYLNDKHKEEIKIANTYEKAAIQEFDKVEQECMDTYNMTIQELDNTEVPAYMQEGKNRILQKAYNTQETLALANSSKFNAMSYYDLKTNKAIEEEYVEGLKAVRNEWKRGWNTGQAGVVLAKYDLLSRIDNAEAAEKISKEFQDAEDVQEQSRVLAKYQLAYGGQETLDAILDSPIEWVTSLVANSVSQMLPIGVRIVPATTAIGAGIGAVATIEAGGAGAVPGAIEGYRNGMALTTFGVEYTSSIFDAMREAGYDLTDPTQIEAALQDEEVYSRGREIGFKRGLTIGTIDRVTAGIAGRVFKITPNKLFRNIGVKSAEHLVFSSGAEAFGEYMAQKVSGQEVNIKEIISEAGGGVGNNSVNFAINLQSQIRKNANAKKITSLTENKEIASSGKTIEEITHASNRMVESQTISQEEGGKVTEKAGLLGRALDIVNTDRATENISEETSKIMDLLEEKDNISKTEETRAINKERIRDINTEVQELSINAKRKLTDTGIQESVDFVTEQMLENKKKNTNKKIESEYQAKVKEQNKETKKEVKKLNQKDKFESKKVDIIIDKINEKIDEKSIIEKEEDVVDINNDINTLKQELVSELGIEEQTEVDAIIEDHENILNKELQTIRETNEQEVLNWQESRNKMFEHKKMLGDMLPKNYNSIRNSFMDKYADNIKRKRTAKKSFEQAFYSVKKRLGYDNLSEQAKTYIDKDLKEMSEGKRYRQARFNDKEMAEYFPEYSQKELYMELDKVDKKAREEQRKDITNAITGVKQLIEDNKQYINNKNTLYYIERIRQISKKQGEIRATEIQKLKNKIESDTRKYVKQQLDNSIARVYKAIKTKTKKSNKSSVILKDVLNDFTTGIKKKGIEKTKERINRELENYRYEDDELTNYFNEKLEEVENKSNDIFSSKERSEAMATIKSEYYERKNALNAAKLAIEMLENANIENIENEEVKTLIEKVERNIENAGKIDDLFNKDYQRMKIKFKEQAAKLQSTIDNVINALQFKKIDNIDTIINEVNEKEEYSKDNFDNYINAIKDKIKKEESFKELKKKEQKKIISKLDDLRYVSKKKKIQEAINKIVEFKENKRIVQPLLPFENLHGLLEAAFVNPNKTSRDKAINDIMNKVNKANTNFSKIERKFNNDIKKALAVLNNKVEIGGKKDNYRYKDIMYLELKYLPKEIKDVLGIDNIPNEITYKGKTKVPDMFKNMSIDKLISFYLTAQQDGVMQSWEKRYNNDQLNSTYNFIEHILNNDKTLKEYKDNVIKFFNKQTYDTVNDTYKIMNNENLEKRENYYPLWTNRNNIANDQTKGRKQISISRTKERQGGGDYKIYTTRDAISNYKQWASEYSAYKELQTYLNNIFGNKEVKIAAPKNLLQMRENKKVINKILDISESLTNSQVEQPFGTWYGHIARNFAVANLKNNPKQVITQMLSMFNAAVDMKKKYPLLELPILNYANWAVNMFRNKGEFYQDIMKSDYMRNRIKNNEMDIDLMKVLNSQPVIDILTRKTKYGVKMKELDNYLKQNIGMSFVKYGDVGAFLGYKAAYNTAYDNAVKMLTEEAKNKNEKVDKKYIEQEARKIATENTIAMADKVQQSRYKTNLTSFQTKDVSQLLPYYTTKFQYQQQINKSLRDLSRKGRTSQERMQALGRLMNYGVLQTVLYNTVNNIWFKMLKGKAQEGDEEELKKSVDLLTKLETLGMYSLTQGVPIVNQAMDYLGRKMKDEYTFDTNPIYSLTVINDIIENAGKIIEINDKIDDKDLTLEKLSEYESRKAKYAKEISIDVGAGLTGMGINNIRKYYNLATEGSAYPKD